MVVSAAGGRQVAVVGDTSRGGRGERVTLWLHPAESQASCASPAIVLGTGGDTETRWGRGSGRQRLQPGTPCTVPPSPSPPQGWPGCGLVPGRPPSRSHH